MERNFDEAEGVELEVEAPGASTDVLWQLEAGRADLAILDIHLPRPWRASRALMSSGCAPRRQRLLALLVLAAPDVRRLRRLAGQRVGVTGLPSDDAVGRLPCVAMR